jgi:hypothetical protein
VSAESIPPEIIELVNRLRSTAARLIQEELERAAIERSVSDGRILIPNEPIKFDDIIYMTVSSLEEEGVSLSPLELDEIDRDDLPRAFFGVPPRVVVRHEVPGPPGWVWDVQLVAFQDTGLIQVVHEREVDTGMPFVAAWQPVESQEAFEAAFIEAHRWHLDTIYVGYYLTSAIDIRLLEDALSAGWENSEWLTDKIWFVIDDYLVRHPLTDEELAKARVEIRERGKTSEEQEKCELLRCYLDVAGVTDTVDRPRLARLVASYEDAGHQTPEQQIAATLAELHASGSLTPRCTRCGRQMVDMECPVCRDDC